MGRVFCSADWHGCGEIGNKILDYLQPDDTLYFIGDAIDRGYDGFDLMMKLINDSRVIYLRGNHEQMMGNGITHLINNYRNGASTWLDMNGGETTWYSIEDFSEKELKMIVNVIGQIPMTAIYNNKNGQRIILEHAGHSPFDIYACNRMHDPLWDRDHFFDDWNTEGNKLAENTYIVHGHTPVQYLDFHFGYKDQPPLTKEGIALQHKWNLDEDMGDYKPTVIRYCDGHKFDIDMCTVVSHRGVLLDLDTFEEIYFDVDQYWWEKVE